MGHFTLAWHGCTIVWKCKYAASPIAQLEINDANGVSWKREVVWVVEVHSIEYTAYIHERLFKADRLDTGSRK
jgi:hypothetical protein